MFKNLFRSFGGSDASDLESVLAPHRCEVEFALVLVEAPANHQLGHTIRGVTGSAVGYGGTVLQILGSLILVGFSGVLGCAPKSQREAFISHVCSSYKFFVKVVHGKANALVGTVGYDERVTYTVIPDHFGAIIEKFSKLSRGEAVEHFPAELDPGISAPRA